MTWLELSNPADIIDTRDWRRDAAAVVDSQRDFGTIEGPFTVRIQAPPSPEGWAFLGDLIRLVTDALVLGAAVTGDHLCQEVTACWLPGVSGVRVLVLPTKERT